MLASKGVRTTKTTINATVAINLSFVTLPVAPILAKDVWEKTGKSFQVSIFPPDLYRLYNPDMKSEERQVNTLKEESSKKNYQSICFRFLLKRFCLPLKFLQASNSYFWNPSKYWDFWLFKRYPGLAEKLPSSCEWISKPKKFWIQSKRLIKQSLLEHFTS